MEWGAWLIFTLVLGTPAVYFVFFAPDPVKLGERLARRTIAQSDPWASWKEIKGNLDASRKKEHEDWQTDFNRLVQATCAHSYPATHSDPTFYTCLKCKYEEPWEYHEVGCECRYEVVTTLSSPFPEYRPTKRSLHCPWHGVDWPINKRSDRSSKPFKINTNNQKTPRWEDVWSQGGKL